MAKRVSPRATNRPTNGLSQDERHRVQKGAPPGAVPRHPLLGNASTSACGATRTIALPQAKVSHPPISAVSVLWVHGLKARNASLRRGQTRSSIGRPWFEGQGDTDQAHKCATAAPAIGKALPGLIRSLSDNCPALAHRVIPLRCGIWSLLGYSGHRPGRADQARSMNTRALKKISQPGYLDDVFGEHHGTDQPALRSGVDFVEMTLVDG